jgi:hypothetical protein
MGKGCLTIIVVLFVIGSISNGLKSCQGESTSRTAARKAAEATAAKRHDEGPGSFSEPPAVLARRPTKGRLAVTAPVYASKDGLEQTLMAIALAKMNGREMVRSLDAISELVVCMPDAGSSVEITDAGQLGGNLGEYYRVKITTGESRGCAGFMESSDVTAGT